MGTRKQLYWEDVREGQELPCDFSLKIDWTQVAKSVSGSQDFYAVHHDPDFARAHGHRDLFVMRGFMNGCFNRLIHAWIGDEGFLRRFHLEFRKSNYFGDTITLRGKVTRRYVSNGDHCVDADVWCENQRDGITTPCNCTVTLPSRASHKAFSSD
ncbi:MAG: hypothetical protein Q7T05_07730 [Dehalococcoidia bacterium]|nr:hypothetical protein [Dehalococcoidia bacterium]